MRKHSWLLIAPLAFIGLVLAVAPLLLPREAERQDGSLAVATIPVAAELPIEAEPVNHGATECFPAWEPYYRKYLRSSVALVARDRGQREAAVVLHDATGAVPTSGLIPIQIHPEVAVQSLTLSLGSPVGRKTGEIDWNTCDTVSAEFIQFLRDMPDRECPDLARWSYVVSFLGNRDPSIMEAIREVVTGDPLISRPKRRELRENLPRSFIRRNFLDPEAPREQKGIVALLLGFCGNAEDEAALRQIAVLSEDLNQWRYVCRAMSGYFLVTDGSGIEIVAADKLKKKRGARRRCVRDDFRDPLCHDI